ncbi:hypothetical protein VSS74_04465 [Conexibacter stalactiti]|uniref:Uncharacterized protein n=1 Tax=Conexibacter stalactiti TaxID=1940611 RepID=A0ABU4HJV2_9ACTN|nr:hypothetical protein [Conexibacter stalactiti]MDW5593576.1 hypothetical protein [Conexibacter stalactiti]MEC5034217.1 hypothetical protein [Conexibacter stalactiti]
MPHLPRSVLALPLSLVLTLAASSAARAVTVGDAYANAGANQCSWTIGTAASEKVLTFSSGTYTLTSFKNKLTSPVREYVSASTPSREVRFEWDGTTITGATPGWSCVSGSAATATVGGQSAIKLDVTIGRSGVQVTKHYLVHPSTGLMREWSDYKNTGSGAASLVRPSFLEQHVLGDDTADTTLRWMTGAKYAAGSWELRQTALSSSYARTFDSYDQFDCPANASGVAGFGDIATYNASGHLGQREWHDSSGGYVWPDAQHPGPSSATSRTWVAPTSGTVDVASHAAKVDAAGNGVVVKVLKNDDVIFSPTTIAGSDTTGIAVNVANVTVRAGDRIRFVIEGNGDWSNDSTGWNPTVTYQGGGASYRASSGFSSTQGANAWRYEDFGSGAACPIAGWAETSFNYIPWFTLFDRAEQDGVAVGFDYYGRWALRAGNQEGAGALSLSIPNYSKSLVAGETISSPRAFTQVYVDDLDDMTNRLLDWQYRYMWDYTRDPYFTAIRMLGYWFRGSQWTGTWDQAGTLQKIFGLAPHMQTIGADTYHRDNGWWDKPGDWNGPDFRQSNDLLAKSGTKQLIYMMAYNANLNSDAYRANPGWFVMGSPCGYADRLIDLTQPGAEAWMGDLLIGKAAAWGDFQWRNDSCPVTDWPGAQQLAQDQAFRRVQARFLDTRTGSAIQGVDSGGYETSWEFMRMASGYSITDRDGFAEQHDASRLFPADKISGIPDTWDPGNCTTRWNSLLMYNPDFTGDTSDPVKLACMRKLIEKYRYLRANDVVGRWVHQYHPAASDNERNWFQRVSGDGSKSLVIYKGSGSGSAVTVYPRGLTPGTTYDVRYELGSGSASRTGSDLMTNGIRLASIGAGELIWIGMPKHPGGGADRTAPGNPTNVQAHVRTNMNWAGVDVTWDAGSDDHWVSGYQISLLGRVIGTVSKGRYFFHSGAMASPNAPYVVKTIDGDGNLSSGATAGGFTVDTTGVEDDDSAVTYSGGWDHQRDVIDASGETLSRSAGTCNDACTGFSGTQGANNWRYQDFVSGRWQDISTYAATGGYLGMREWHDASGGFVWPSALHPGESNDTARTWVAPRAGTVDITGNVAKFVTGGDGVVVKITKNGTTIWGTRTIGANDTTGVAANVSGVAVAAGDAIRFEVNRGSGNYQYDATAWDPFVRYSTDPPPPAATTATASWSFSGSQVTYLAKLGPDLGKVDVKIDGVTDTTLDLYAPDDTNHQIPVYTKTFGAVGRHTISIAPAGSKNSRSSGLAITLDGFQALTNAPTVVAETDASITYAGSGWSTSGGVRSSATAGDTATVRFTGRRITWVGPICAACGSADVSLDGAFAARVDTFGFRGPSVGQAALYQATFPTSGPHTLTVRVLGTRNLDSSASTVGVDAFHVRP